LRQLAEDAVARGADVLGMAGGDGSQALVASIASQHSIPFVVVPAGARNHFAWIWVSTATTFLARWTRTRTVSNQGGARRG
jgi:predicted polyphosphate/ATP-dependent NAD kinase